MKADMTRDINVLICSFTLYNVLHIPTITSSYQSTVLVEERLCSTRFALRFCPIASVVELRAVRSCVAKCLAQLASWIRPPVTLPIALPITLFIVTGGGVVEVTEIWFGRCRSVASVAELVGTLTFMETTAVMTKVFKRLALRNKSRRRCVGCGQQRSIDGSRPHGWMR